MRWWLLWAGWLYGLAGRIRATSYRRGWLARRKLPVPVVSVGNLTVGGTGKTPFVIRLAEGLSREGKRVAILSRGYRRGGAAPRLIVSNGAKVLGTPDEAGDEPYLMARRCPTAVVAVGADRYALGRWVLDQFPVDYVLLDDGFQHLAVQRDVDLLLVDATDFEGLRAVFPAGRLREPIGAAARASMIVVTKADRPEQAAAIADLLQPIIPGVPIAQAVFRPETLVSVADGSPQPLDWCRGKTAVLCSGIADPAAFRALAIRLGMTPVEHMIYRDHHRYTREDVTDVRAKAAAAKTDLILTTEKDAGKLAPLLAPSDGGWWAVRLGTDIVAGERELRELIAKASAGGTGTAYA
ncbi:Tetraacyldisaccharide 4'-kinase [Nitrospira japonica]|uniref:Tetraacyldisaccharide 4'-kinase n=1 Tax=Nitrospira japonica TaxID=1325564 RepID=A0A1W1HZM8_9BACT|nr:Tetraacyldisaccharide 4'-kinase [Nitrospira japonica]